MRIVSFGRMLCLAVVLGGFLSARAEANQVTAAREGGLLKVFGDNAANQIVIARQGSDVVITGKAGTKVNGKASVRFKNFAVNAAEVRMGAGNDVVTLNNLLIAVDLFVDLGSGADRLRTGLLPSVIGVNLAVEGGLGNDTVQLTGMMVGEDLYVNGQAGSLNAQLTGLEIGKSLTLIGDNANDIISIAQTTTADASSIETKGGSDDVYIVDFAAFALSVNTDLGHDTVTMERVFTLEDLGVFAGAGHDSLELVDVASGKNVKVTMDIGNDLVSATNVHADYDAVFEGGDGMDTIADNGITGGEKKEIKEFEILL